MSSDLYLLDSDILIHAKNSYLSPDIAPAFWQWIIKGHEEGLFFSIDRVADEFRLGDKEDYLYKFAENHSTFFLASSDPETVEEYINLQNWANTEWVIGKKSANASKGTEAFASESKADAFLVAYAKAHGYKIVTNELSNIFDQTNIKIPDAAESCGLETPINLRELLLLHSHDNFQFR